MSPNIKRFALAAAAAVGLAFCIVSALKSEPPHKGKPVDYSVDQAYDADNGIGDQEKTMKEVIEIGPRAIRNLVRRLQTSDSWRNAYLRFRSSVPERWQRPFPDLRTAEEERYGAIRLLAWIGPDAKEALPYLHSVLTNRSIVLHDTSRALRLEIAGALWQIGAETNKVLEICTNTPFASEALINATLLLSVMSTAAAPAVPFALEVLQNTNCLAARGNAIGILGAARVSNPQIRATLLDGTAPGQDGRFRAGCAVALWRLDSQYAQLATRLVIEQLVAMSNRPPDIAEDFMTWVERSGLDPRQAIPTLRQLLERDSPEMRAVAAEVLQRIEDSARPGKK